MMPRSTAILTLPQDEDLSDVQVKELLQEAEDRLRARTRTVQDVAVTCEPSVANILVPRKPLPKLTHGLKTSSYIREKDGVAQVDAARLINDEQRKLANNARTAEPLQQSKKSNNELSAGADWFELPKTALTPQIKRDFQLLEMRSVLDPHRHWKKDSRKGKVPTFSQVGTVIQGPTEWYSSRINKKDRAKNFVEETMATEKNSGRFKRKYDEIQAGKTSGKKAHYKSLMSKRKRTS